MLRCVGASEMEDNAVISEKITKRLVIKFTAIISMNGENRLLELCGAVCMKRDQQLKYIRFTNCKMLWVVEIDAPNLRSFHCDGILTKISVRNYFQLKNVNLSDILSDGRARLSSIIEIVESLDLHLSYLEVKYFLGFTILITKLLHG